jgi:hypothetical protein
VQERLLHQLPRQLRVGAGAQRQRDRVEGGVGQVGARLEDEVLGRDAERGARAPQQMEVEERAVDAALTIPARDGDRELRAAGGRAGDAAGGQLAREPDQQLLGSARRLGGIGGIGDGGRIVRSAADRGAPVRGARAAARAPSGRRGSMGPAPPADKVPPSLCAPGRPPTLSRLAGAAEMPRREGARSRAKRGT